MMLMQESLRLQPNRWQLLAILLLSWVFLYLQVFILPNVPRIANGDQGIYLSNAGRML